MGGLGFGLMYLPAMDILCKYFDRYLREAAKKSSTSVSTIGGAG